MTDEKNAVAAYHLHCLSDMLAWAIREAAKNHPEELREAFAAVFSSEAVEGMARRTFNLAAEGHRLALEAKALMEQVSKDVDAVESRLDGLNAYLDGIREKFRNKSPNGAAKPMKAKT